MSKILEVWENRAAIFNRRNALLTLIGLGVVWGGIAYCNRETAEPTQLLPPRDGAGEGTPTDGGSPVPGGAVSTNEFVPEIVYTSGPDAQGVFQATIYGTILAECVKMNRPDRWYDSNLPEKDYDPSLPTIISGIEALSVPGMGVDGIDPPPYWHGRGFYVSPIGDLQAHGWSMLNTGASVCVGVAN